jgi:hypothetical protein
VNTLPLAPAQGAVSLYWGAAAGPGAVPVVLAPFNGYSFE